jgi:phosphatidylglycerol:prolipoprotein diacylglycerol transferase
MIPYFQVPPLELGALKVQPFGFLVIVAVGVFILVAHYRGLALGLYAEQVMLGSAVVVGGALVGGHLFSAVAYFPERMDADPMHLVQLFDGQSLFGGFLGGTIAGVVYLLVRRFPLLLFAEPYVYATVVSLIFGRLGCALVHDHPGRVTTFWGAVQGWPDGTTRHDLGLYELVLMIALTGVIYALRNRRAIPGLQIAVPMIAYGVVRFLLDFLRVADKRYGGFTPGQYGALLLLVGGVSILAYGWLRPGHIPGLANSPGAIPTPPEPPPEPPPASDNPRPSI